MKIKTEPPMIFFIGNLFVFLTLVLSPVLPQKAVFAQYESEEADEEEAPLSEEELRRREQEEARRRQEDARRREEEARRREEEARRRAEEARQREEEARLGNLLNKAEAFEKEENFLSAREIYEQILEKEKLTPAQQKEIADRFAQANYHLLLSPQEMPESTVHVVKKGDSLYKIAKKYNTTVDLLQKSNKLKSDLIFPDQKLKVVTVPFSIRVDKSDNELFLYLAGKPVKRYRVATGTDNGTPVGEFKITTKLENPVWYHAGAVVPPDSPDNILGTRWLGFNKPGYGIHGTTKPESIGKQETLGCVRMLNEDVEELYSLVPSGTEVIIVD